MLRINAPFAGTERCSCGVDNNQSKDVNKNVQKSGTPVSVCEIGGLSGTRVWARFKEDRFRYGQP